MKNTLTGYTEPRLLSKWELYYLRAGICLFITGPIQVFLFCTLAATQDLDLVFFFPVASIMIWALPSALVWNIVFMVAAGGRENMKEMTKSLGKTGFFIFSAHAGLLMICRIIFLVIARLIIRDWEWRMNEPYILWWPRS